VSGKANVNPPTATAAKPNAGEAKAGAIADRGYTPYRGAHTPLSSRGRVVARQALRSMAKQAWVIVTLALSAFPLLICAGWMWMQSMALQKLPIDGKLASVGTLDATVAHFASHWSTLLLSFFIALFAGGGAVADDARAGAFQFYFARPLTRHQYLWGKLAAVTTLTALASLVPPVLVAAIRLELAAPGELGAKLPAVGAALLLGLVQAIALSAPALALSSLTKRRGLAQAGFAGFFLLPWIAGGILAQLTRSAWPKLLSLPANFDNLGHWLFRVPLDPDVRMVPVWASAAVVAALVAGALVLARRQLASVEVIAS
jgi:ABC-type transport system involved in multi-copper enzyme maturation permease subunit